MHEPDLEPDATVTIGPQLRKALERIDQIVVDGLSHGHFRCTIFSGIGKNKRRELVMEAGKSHKFTIPEDDLPP
jgi:hypothetical protein